MRGMYVARVTGCFQGRPRRALPACLQVSDRITLPGVTVVPPVRLRARAAQTLVLVLISVLIAILLVAPQPSAALGWELLPVAAVSDVVLVIMGRWAGHATDRGVARYIGRFSPLAWHRA